MTFSLTTNYPNGLSVWGPQSGGPGVPLLPGQDASYFGNIWFVDTVNGSDGNDGRSPNSAFATMGRALWLDTITAGAGTTSNVGPNDTIYAVGTVRQQLIAPLTKVVNGTARAVTGVKIVGMAQGGVRDDDGAKWTYPASGATAGMALLRLRQQGWVVTGFLWTPEPTSGAAIEARRAEDATNPDASHAIIFGNRFVGIDVTTTYGIKDVGGCSAMQIYGNEFYLLTTGIYTSSTSIALPLRWQIGGNRFLQNTNDMITPLSNAVVQGNTHLTDGTTVFINFLGGANNTVKFNSFPDVAADVDNAHGYTGSTTDVWTSNSAADQVIFGIPGA